MHMYTVFILESLKNSSGDVEKIFARRKILKMIEEKLLRREIIPQHAHTCTQNFLHFLSDMCLGMDYDKFSLFNS